MDNKQMYAATTAVEVIRPFLSRTQLATMIELGRQLGAEGEFFLQQIIDLAEQIKTMPKSYEQDGLGDQAVAHLHYFTSGSDWYITEKDVDGGVRQTFGYAILNGDDQSAECGYTSIEELTQLGVELDLYFTLCTLGDIKAAREFEGRDSCATQHPDEMAL